MSMFEFMKLSKKLDTILDSDVITNGAVKSIQRGVTTSGTSSNVTVTINSVNPDKCFCILQKGKTGGSGQSEPYIVSINSNSLVISPAYYIL